MRGLIDAFERGDAEYQLAHLDPQIEVVAWPESPDRRTYRGHRGALRARESWAEAWEWLRNDVDEIVDAGDRVIVCGVTRGKGKRSSVEVTIGAFNVYTLRDGKVTRLQFFTTREQAFQAAGLEHGEPGGHSPGGSEGTAIVRGFVDAFNRRDMDALLAVCDPAVELSEWPAAVGARTYTGHEGARAALDSWLESWEWMTVEIVDLEQVGDRVLATFHQRAKGRGSAVEVEVTSYNVFTFRDGRTVRMQLFTERELALEAAGLVPTYEEERR